MSVLDGLPVYEGVVLPEWIDINGHMNVAYYLLAFDQAVDSLWTRIGITADYIAETRGSTFAVESHVTWQRELNEGDDFLITSQIIAFDQKRIHQFQRLYHAQEQYLAATAEWMNLHVDLDARRVSHWPAKTIAALHEVASEQNETPPPPELGSRMGIKQPLFSIG
ncbi:MAG: thioesterase family protein [Woeseia sp.]|nr:thioesterase family protein [Woeseia sp.]NNL55789.1 thioesterase family protein [Woeseia sp.]